MPETFRLTVDNAGANFMATHAIAAEFVPRYQDFWNAGAHDLAVVYTGDAVPCRLEIVRSRERIGPVLDAIVGQGWTTISSKSFRQSRWVKSSCSPAATQRNAPRT